MRTARAQAGFTLTEVMISMVVMMIGMAALIGLYITVTKTNAAATRVTRAKSYAEERMEDLRAASVTQMQASVTTVEDKTESGVVYHIHHDVAPTPTDDTLLVVTVTVTYAEDGDEDHPHTSVLQMLRTTQEVL